MVDRRHYLLVGQHLIGVFHPVFVQILDFVSDRPVTECALRPPCLNHRVSSRVSARRRPAAAAHG
jgi:hypothetical protein